MASGEGAFRVAVVFQDSMLLRASIADNIRLGRPGATDEQVQAAARQAQIHDRVMELPQGYDTVLGSEGSGPVGRRGATRGHRARYRPRCAYSRARRGDRPCGS